MEQRLFEILVSQKRIRNTAYFFSGRKTTLLKNDIEEAGGRGSNATKEGDMSDLCHYCASNDPLIWKEGVNIPPKKWQTPK